MSLDTANALITVEDARDFLKVSTEGQDAILESLINKASAWANNYTGRLLLSRTHTEYLDGDGTATLILGQTPVTTLTSVNDDPLRAWGSGTAINTTTDLAFDAESGILRYWTGGAFTTGYGNVKVVYVGGYPLASVPEPIREAVLLYVGFAYRSTYLGQRIGVVSETVGDRTTAYIQDDIPKKCRMLLDAYKTAQMVCYAI